jgi:hypothetical protein
LQQEAERRLEAMVVLPTLSSWIQIPTKLIFSSQRSLSCNSHICFFRLRNPSFVSAYAVGTTCENRNLPIWSKRIYFALTPHLFPSCKQNVANHKALTDETGSKGSARSSHGDGDKQ